MCGAGVSSALQGCRDASPTRSGLAQVATRKPAGGGGNVGEGGAVQQALITAVAFLRPAPVQVLVSLLASGRSGVASAGQQPEAWPGPPLCAQRLCEWQPCKILYIP